MYMYMYQDKTAASLPTVLTLPSGKCPHSRTQWPHWVSDSCNILRYVGGYNRHNQMTLGKWTLSPHYEWCQIQSTCTTGAHPVHVMFIYTVKLWCTCTCTPWHCSVALCVDKCTGHDSFLLNSVARMSALNSHYQHRVLTNETSKMPIDNDTWRKKEADESENIQTTVHSVWLELTKICVKWIRLVKTKQCKETGSLTARSQILFLNTFKF